MPSSEGTNSTSNCDRESHWCPMVGKSSSPIRTLFRPSGRGNPVASVVRATETDGAMAVEPAHRLGLLYGLWQIRSVRKWEQIAPADTAFELALSQGITH